MFPNDRYLIKTYIDLNSFEHEIRNFINMKYNELDIRQFMSRIKFVLMQVQYSFFITLGSGWSEGGGPKQRAKKRLFRKYSCSFIE